MQTTNNALLSYKSGAATTRGLKLMEAGEPSSLSAPTFWKSLCEHSVAASRREKVEGYIIGCRTATTCLSPSFIFRQPANEHWQLDADFESLHDVAYPVGSSDWTELARRLFREDELEEAFETYQDLVATCEMDGHFLGEVEFVKLPVTSTFMSAFDELPSKLRMLPLKDDFGRNHLETSVQLAWLSGRKDAARIAGEGVWFRRSTDEPKTDCFIVTAHWHQDELVNNVTVRYGHQYGGDSPAFPKPTAPRAERFPFYEPAHINCAYADISIGTAAERVLTLEEANKLAELLSTYSDFTEVKLVKTSCVAEGGMADIMGLPITGAPTTASAHPEDLKAMGFHFYLTVWQPAYTESELAEDGKNDEWAQDAGSCL
jgi:hypothetical protein